MNGLTLKKLIEKQKGLTLLSNYNTLQSQKQIDVFNLVKDKYINTSSIQSVDIYLSDDARTIQSKIQSKIWMVMSLYDNLALTDINCNQSTPCLLGKVLVYFDYTTDSNYVYTIGLGLFGPSPCDNPITTLDCVSVLREHKTDGSTDELIPTNIINEAINKILPGSGTLTDNSMMLIIGGAVIIVGFLLLRKK